MRRSDVYKYFSVTGCARMRCNICYDKWLLDAAKLVPQQGLLLMWSSTLRSMKVPSWVQTYNKGCTHNMRGHLMKAHDAEEQGPACKKQATLQESVQKGLETADDAGRRVALAFCFNPIQHAPWFFLVLYVVNGKF